MVPGLMAIAILMAGVQGVLIPLVQDLSGSREVDERLLAGWGRISAAKAMFFSFVACSRNWRAFLAYALGLMLVVMVPSLLIGVLALVSPLIGQLLSIALPAVFIPVVFASFYANALDVFGTITPDDAA